ncbi:MAG: helicase-related protein [Gammaproteobacteria bacterium]
MPDVRRLFADLRRVEVKHQPKPGGWRMEEIAAKAQEETQRAGSCLVIVNTKRSAQTLYRLCATDASFPVFHLSTHMCPAHRKSVLAGVRRRLERHEPTLCVSTQLIEAGVDVDFGTVIRFTAGLDAIAQAAGRCNRNGTRPTGRVHVVNPAPNEEKIGMLPDIEIGRDKAERVLDDYEADPERFGYNLIGPEAIGWYYQNYFFARAKDMEYPIGVETLGREDTLLNLLSANCQAVAEYKKTKNQAPLYLRQSFMAASKAFKTIDAPTRGIIVPYGQTGREVVAALCAAYLPDKEFDLLRRAQQFTVNVLPQTLDLLGRGGAIREIQEGSSILFLADSRYYSDEFGLGETPDGIMEVLSV